MLGLKLIQDYYMALLLSNWINLIHGSEVMCVTSAYISKVIWTCVVEKLAYLTHCPLGDFNKILDK